MGTIKDIIDLSTQLANSVQDRHIANEINKIQMLTLELQSEQAGLHEKNIILREEKLALNEKIQSLEAEIKELNQSSSLIPDGIPTCPNCSTSSKPYFMKPIDAAFVEISGVTHECSRCDFTANV